MLRTYLKDAFSSFHAGASAWHDEEVTDGRCNAMLARTIEHVVDETDSRIRIVPNYARRLKKPVENVFRLIDELVESLPKPLDCRRSSYTRDGTVRALFASPVHMQKVFSESSDIRRFFDEHPDQEECWSLMCMQKNERRQAGMAMVGDRIVRDVLQTVVSFSDHQLMSPGRSEEDARCALKSCIFDSLLMHARLEARSASNAGAGDEDRLPGLGQKPSLQDGNDIPAGRSLEGRISGSIWRGMPRIPRISSSNTTTVLTFQQDVATLGLANTDSLIFGARGKRPSTYNVANAVKGEVMMPGVPKYTVERPRYSGP